MASLDTLEPFGAAGSGGLHPGSTLVGSRASHCQGTMQGGVPAPVTSTGRGKKEGMLFAGGMAEALKLPSNCFLEREVQQDVVEPPGFAWDGEQWECGGFRW